MLCTGPHQICSEHADRFSEFLGIGDPSQTDLCLRQCPRKVLITNYWVLRYAGSLVSLIGSSLQANQVTGAPAASVIA
eukprot:1990572-Amphidinium_carterae.1